MSRYIKHIFLTLTAVLLAVSCLEEMESPQPMPQDEALTLVPRVHNFANQYVTKAAYNADEHVISSISVLIFNSEGTLLDILESTSNKVSVNKTNLSRHGSLVDAKIVMFANIDLDDVQNSTGSIIDNKDNLKYTDLAGYTCHLNSDKVVITDLSISGGFTGFPMTGETTADLSPTDTQQAAIEVPLKILYAKINFEIAVEQSSENQTIVSGGSTFSLTGYTVNNVATSTKYEALAEGTATPAGTTYKTDAVSGSATGSVNLSSTTPIKFTFYMAESCYNHNLASLNGIYPSDEWLTQDPSHDVNGYNSLTDEQKALPANKLNGVKYLYDDLIQQYKPKLADVDGATPGKGLATYVTVNGTYTDYRGTPWTVSYKVYLGKDNAQDFHVDRNSEYTNILTIKGIRNNDDHTGTDVWIDHRVDVSTTALSGNVTITRETLIDSHIEVRPLRVNWQDNKWAGVRLYLPVNGSTLVNWIGIEKFTGENCLESSTYCYTGNTPTGKRKYFTTSLISELQTKGGEFGVETEDGQTFLYLRNGDCAWIYFDENTTASDRTATLKLTFYSEDGKTTADEIYTVTQRGLQTVGGYYIESYEEYLHSYDSADKYNLTTSPYEYTQQGLAWGLAGKQISKDIIVSAGPLEVSGIGGIQGLVSQRYDFFHSSDVPSGNSYHTYTNVSGSWAKTSYGTGLTFTERASAHEKMTIMDMGTIPSSAYQYCLSKNKFKEDANGNHTMDIHWYLPDVYELGAILTANQSSADLSADAYYWSSQPSYEGLGIDQIPLIGQYLDDVNIQSEVTANARAATKGSVTNTARTEKHRIRCVYSAAGIKNVDMSERAPDGMGGIFSFWMKGWTDGGKNTAGFFNYMLPSPSTPAGDTQKSDVPNVTYPTKANSQSADAEFPYIVTEGKNGQIEGFEKNPGDKNNWNKYSLSSTHYYTLRDYPGLSDYTLDKATLTDAYEETSTRKSITESSTMTSKVVKTQSLPSTFTLNPLDEKLRISFSQAGGNNVPVFTYDELYSQVKTTSTQYWNKPVYTGTTYELNPETKTLSSPGGGSETGISTGTSTYQQASVEDAKRNAFDGTRVTSTLTNNVDGAYPKAKNDAKGKLDELLKNYPTTDGWVHGSYNYTSLSWDQQVSNIQWSEPIIETGSQWSFSGTKYYTKKVTITCTVTVTGTITVTKPGSKTLYLQTEGTGVWSTATTSTESSGPTVNTDQLRVYCGNSFTISLADAYKDDYEITKVKVHYSGGNLISQNTLRTETVFGRFVESSISLPMTGDGGTSIMGMEYLEDSDAGTGTHQWAGKGTDTVTLLLADYTVKTESDFNIDWGNLGNSSLIKYTYTYSQASKNLSKYVIIDRIEVKCTKKATAASE